MTDYLAVNPFDIQKVNDRPHRFGLYSRKQGRVCVQGNIFLNRGFCDFLKVPRHNETSIASSLKIKQAFPSELHLWRMFWSLLLQSSLGTRQVKVFLVRQERPSRWLDQQQGLRWECCCSFHGAGLSFALLSSSLPTSPFLPNMIWFFFNFPVLFQLQFKRVQDEGTLVCPPAWVRCRLPVEEFPHSASECHRFFFFFFVLGNTEDRRALKIRLGAWKSLALVKTVTDF